MDTFNEFTLEIAQNLKKSSESFPIDFEDAWKWLEYPTKEKAKRFFEKCNFNSELDFQVTIQNDNNPSGERPTEISKITVNCFMSWAIISKRPASNLILDLLKSAGCYPLNRTFLISFKELLFSAISWKTLILTQYYVEINGHKYFIDFYLPEYHLAIEYVLPQPLNEEISRELKQLEIESYLGCKFIRVVEKSELKALTEIIKIVFR